MQKSTSIDLLRNEFVCGDTLTLLRLMPAECVDMVITSPPYWGLRDYGTGGIVWGGAKDCEHDFSLKNELGGNNRNGITESESWQTHRAPNSKLPRASGMQFGKSHTCAKCGAWRGELGLEPQFTQYLDHLIEIFAEVKRVLKDSGTVWVNLGDTYNTGKRGNTNGTYGPVKQKDGINDMGIDKPEQAGLPKKTTIGIPDRFKIRMIDELGFSCRNEIIWHKPNNMPQSAKDRFAVDYEKLYFFVKNPSGYYFDTQYEPLSEATLKEIEKLYNGKATKDYAAAGAQDASSVKARIVRGLREKQGTDQPPGEHENRHGQSMMQALAAGLDRLDDKLRNAINQGWQPEKETYEHWYFETRERKGWHNHENDAERGNSRKGRSDPNSNVPLYHPLGRLKRSVWRIPVKPFPGAHFAVFPQELIETPIKAGCPAIICANCGAPAKTAYSETRTNTRKGANVGKGKSGKDLDPNKDLHKSDLSRYRQAIQRNAAGLMPGCKCESAPGISGLVLDPFMGAGTTAVVCKRLGRDYLGFELKQEYVEIARKRLADCKI